MGLSIKDFVHDGFCKIADVETDYQYHTPKNPNWQLTNTNDLLLYSEHDSWIYCIVRDDTIVKIGETGNPLGVRNQDGSLGSGTKGRLGRLCTHGKADEQSTDTDSRIRYELKKDADDGLISIWAKQCPVETTTMILGGKEKTIRLQTHKSLEVVFLDHIFETTGAYPEMNKGRK